MGYQVDCRDCVVEGQENLQYVKAYKSTFCEPAGARHAVVRYSVISGRAWIDNCQVEYSKISGHVHIRGFRYSMRACTLNVMHSILDGDVVFVNIESPLLIEYVHMWRNIP